MAPPAAEIDAPQAEPRVGVVRVEGNQAVDSARIVRSFEVLPGSRFSADAVRRGIRKLVALGLFRDVTVRRDERDGVVDLVIVVQERPKIATIQFRGNQRRETSELEKKLFLKPGDVYAPGQVQLQLDSLRLWYRDEGFPRATVEARTDSVAGSNQVGLTFEIAEGERLKIQRVTFVGAEAFPAKRLRKAMRTKARGFFGGGDLHEEQWAEDRERLESFYRSEGWRDARVVDQQIVPGPRSDRVVLQITVEEGIRYRFGQIDWQGNTVVSTADLAKLWSGRGGPWYDGSKLERVQGQAYAEYAERGYLFVNVDPAETVRDSNVVDVTFRVAEGKPSHIRQVHIVGNRGTREHVIRREIDLMEGDRFKRSALIRTQGDISRLGLFEEVVPDFQVADSTDVDLYIRVKEKQVGTASAGAGYAGDAGLTGFLELSHNNVLGNGQTLSLHLERGSKRSDYYLSFTEPWFRGTPTLLGFSGFNTLRDRDLYTENRRGGSARIGRPLPWPDYSRGSLAYRLEDVEITEVEKTGSAADSVLLSGLTVDRPVRTSSLDLDFTRNSTDNPFYPTRGSRLSVSSELAGGAFGGAVNFHKHRIEGRAYFPSFLKGVTTMVRARWGILGRYTDQTSDVPTYERFRLGGGSTSDPVRGYEDYQIVPEKFSRDIITRQISRVDTLTGGELDTLYTEFSTRVRYPGGRWMALYSVEQQFPIVVPLRGVVFFDAGNTWDLFDEIQPFDLKLGAGLGFRMEIPLLGNIGFDWGYGFNRDDGPRARGHFLLGNVNF